VTWRASGSLRFLIAVKHGAEIDRLLEAGEIIKKAEAQKTRFTVYSSPLGTISETFLHQPV